MHRIPDVTVNALDDQFGSRIPRHDRALALPEEQRDRRGHQPQAQDDQCEAEDGYDRAQLRFRQPGAWPGAAQQDDGGGQRDEEDNGDGEADDGALEKSGHGIASQLP